MTDTILLAGILAGVAGVMCLKLGSLLAHAEGSNEEMSRPIETTAMEKCLKLIITIDRLDRTGAISTDVFRTLMSVFKDE